MSNPVAHDVQEVLAAYEHHLRARTNDAEIWCELGRVLRECGRPQEVKRCQKRAVDLLLTSIRAGNAELALKIESDLYFSFVRPVETEEHYYRCFSEWREDMARLGRRFQDLPSPQDADFRKVAFVLPTGYLLGHVEVLLRYLSAYREAGGEKLLPVIYVLADCSASFLQACSVAGATVVAMDRVRPTLRSAGIAERVSALREQLRSDRVGCVVWVSIPPGAIFALASRLAPVQIFWALKFHPIAGPYIDGYLTVGPPGTTERVFGKHRWRVVPTPLALAAPKADPSQVEKIRAGFPGKFIFGTVAREEKIRSAAFLGAVSRILKASPDAVYLWTGRHADQEIVSYFRDQGVLERCQFVGWVHSPDYVAAFDVFLETFPFGCGITGYHALGAGTPLLSYFAEDTVFGMQFWNAAGAMQVPQQCPILCATSPDEYVALASRLQADLSFRRETGARGQAFFRDELSLGIPHAEAFFRAIGDVVSRRNSVPAHQPAGSAP